MFRSKGIVFPVDCKKSKRNFTIKAREGRRQTVAKIPLKTITEIICNAQRDETTPWCFYIRWSEEQHHGIFTCSYFQVDEPDERTALIWTLLMKTDFKDVHLHHISIRFNKKTIELLEPEQPNPWDGMIRDDSDEQRISNIEMNDMQQDLGTRISALASVPESVAVGDADIGFEVRISDIGLTENEDESSAEQMNRGSQTLSPQQELIRMTMTEENIISKNSEPKNLNVESLGPSIRQNIISRKSRPSKVNVAPQEFIPEQASVSDSEFQSENGYVVPARPSIQVRETMRTRPSEFRQKIHDAWENMNNQEKMIVTENMQQILNEVQARESMRARPSEFRRNIHDAWENMNNKEEIIVTDNRTGQENLIGRQARETMRARPSEFRRKINDAWNSMNESKWEQMQNQGSLGSVPELSSVSDSVPVRVPVSQFSEYGSMQSDNEFMRPSQAIIAQASGRKSDKPMQFQGTSSEQKSNVVSKQNQERVMHYADGLPEAVTVINQSADESDDSEDIEKVFTFPESTTAVDNPSAQGRNTPFRGVVASLTSDESERRITDAMNLIIEEAAQRANVSDARFPIHGGFAALAPKQSSRRSHRTSPEKSMQYLHPVDKQRKKSSKASDNSTQEPMRVNQFERLQHHALEADRLAQELGMHCQGIQKEVKGKVAIVRSPVIEESQRIVESIVSPNVAHSALTGHKEDIQCTSHGLQLMTGHEQKSNIDQNQPNSDRKVTEQRVLEFHEDMVRKLQYDLLMDKINSDTKMSNTEPSNIQVNTSKHSEWNPCQMQRERAEKMEGMRRDFESKEPANFYDRQCILTRWSRDAGRPNNDNMRPYQIPIANSMPLGEEPSRTISLASWRGTSSVSETNELIPYPSFNTTPVPTETDPRTRRSTISYKRCPCSNTTPVPTETHHQRRRTTIGYKRCKCCGTLQCKITVKKKKRQRRKKKKYESEGWSF